MTIEKVSNGYIVDGPYREKTIYKTIDEVFRYLLLHFEGQSPNFGGKLYGDVKVIREPEDQP